MTSSAAPVVSVLIPTFKPQPDYLRQALESILGQTFQDFEILILDDSPAEEHLVVAKVSAELKDPRIKVVGGGERQGLIASLNDGLKLAKGEFIARMDADDLSLPERFERQLAFMKANPDIAVCGTQFEVFGGRSVVTDHSVGRQAVRDGLLFRGCIIGHPTVMMRRAVLEKFNARYEQRFHHAEDYGLWAVLSHRTQLSNLPDVFLRYRSHSHQTGQVQAANTERVTREIKVFLLESLLAEAEKSSFDLELLRQLIVFRQPVETRELKSLAKLFNRLYWNNRRAAFYTLYPFRLLLQELWQIQYEGELIRDLKRLMNYYRFILVFRPSRLALRRHLGLWKRFLFAKLNSQSRA
jgi:glycosyltransferase involved in cell wall biosynthesis